jgi:conjugal transfer pilus assembly protein TraB
MSIKDKFSDGIKKLAEVFEALSPKQNKAAIIGSAVLAIGTGSYTINKSRQANREQLQKVKVTEEAPQELKIKGDWIKKNKLEQSEATVAKLQGELKKQEQESKSTEEMINQKAVEIEEMLRKKYDLGSKNPSQKTGKYPEPPNSRLQSNSGTAPTRISKGEGVRNIGGIGRVTAQAESSTGEKDLLTPDKNKATYLPMSFMEATLLSGVDAPVMQNGKANPVPVLLMIKAPAFLPNEVKKDLKGCFVTAEGYGSLSSERVNLLTDRISCVKKDGSSFIEEKIKGFVLDVDGKLGLKGRVVARFGSTIARTFLAGAFEGAGEVMAGAATTTTTSTTGETESSVDPDQLKTAMVGKGLSTASKKLSDFYMSMAEQSLPVIETGVKTDVTIVVREGVTLRYRSELTESKTSK